MKNESDNDNTKEHKSLSLNKGPEETLKEVTTSVKGNLTQPILKEIYYKGPRKTILIVDDQKAVLHILKTQLERKGFIVKTAESGTDAIDTISIKIPDFVFIDQNMPNLTGDKTIQIIKNKLGLVDLPIILTTGDLFFNNSEDEKLNLFDSEKILYKPFEREDMLKLVVNNLNLDLIDE